MMQKNTSATKPLPTGWLSRKYEDRYQIVMHFNWRTMGWDIDHLHHIDQDTGHKHSRLQRGGFGQVFSFDRGAQFEGRRLAEVQIDFNEAPSSDNERAKRAVKEWGNALAAWTGWDDL